MQGDETMSDEIPVLPAYVHEGGLKVWCEFCQRWHFHSAGNGHVVAHCAQETPYSKTGYILEAVDGPAPIMKAKRGAR
jgi:hypothetical protein